VVVIDVLRAWTPADRAHAALTSDHCFHLCGANAIPLDEVVVAGAPIEAKPGLLTSRVVARLAVGVPAIAAVAVARELVERLQEAAVRTTLHPLNVTERV
jgi:hypothetical protein